MKERLLGSRLDRQIDAIGRQPNVFGNEESQFMLIKKFGDGVAQPIANSSDQFQESGAPDELGSVDFNAQTQIQ